MLPLKSLDGFYMSADVLRHIKDKEFSCTSVFENGYICDEVSYYLPFITDRSAKCAEKVVTKYGDTFILHDLFPEDVSRSIHAAQKNAMDKIADISESHFERVIVVRPHDPTFESPSMKFMGYIDDDEETEDPYSIYAPATLGDIFREYPHINAFITPSKNTVIVGYEELPRPGWENHDEPYY